MKILFFDLETTGLSSEKNEILEIAAIVYDEDTNTIGNIYDKFIKPKTNIPYQITQLTGITDRMVANSLSEGVTLIDFMEGVKKQGCDKVAGHNIKRFDSKGIDAKTNKFFIKNNMPIEQIDTLNMAKEAYAAGAMPNYNYKTAYGNMSFKLEYLMDYYKLGIQEHKAITDVQFNIMVYKKLKESMENVDWGF